MSVLLVSSILAASSLLIGAVRHVPAGQVFSVRRQGRPNRLLQPGNHLVLPLLERVARRINLQGQMLQLDGPAEAPQLHGTVYWQVLDPQRADAVIDGIDSLIREGAAGAQGDAGETGTPSPPAARIKAALNAELLQHGLMVTRVELA